MISSSSSSSAKMTCGLKVDTNDPGWFNSMTKFLKKIKGASYTIDAEEGMAYITGRANPTKLLRKLQSEKYANLCWVSAGNQITYDNGCYNEGIQMQSPYNFNNAHQLPQGYWHSNHYHHDPMFHYYPPPPPLPTPRQQRQAMAPYPYHHDQYHQPYGYI